MKIRGCDWEELFAIFGFEDYREMDWAEGENAFAEEEAKGAFLEKYIEDKLMGAYIKASRKAGSDAFRHGSGVDKHIEEPYKTQIEDVREFLRLLSKRPYTYESEIWGAISRVEDTFTMLGWLKRNLRYAWC